MTNMLKYRSYVGSADVSLEDDCLHGTIQFIQDTVTYEGKTPAELHQAFVEAVDDYLRTCAELGRQPQKPFSGTFNVRIGAELHKLAALQASKKGMSLNEFVKTAITRAIGESPGGIESFQRENETFRPGAFERKIAGIVEWDATWEPTVPPKGSTER
jgi:predicted HicB family RNase H-like nuclease